MLSVAASAAPRSVAPFVRTGTALRAPVRRPGAPDSGTGGNTGLLPGRGSLPDPESYVKVTILSTAVAEIVMLEGWLGNRSITRISVLRSPGGA